MKHREHRLVDRLLLGREYPEVHRFMDEPARWVGRGHRRYRHDAATSLLLLARTGDVGAAASALMHIACDRAESAARRRRA